MLLEDVKLKPKDVQNGAINNDHIGCQDDAQKAWVELVLNSNRSNSLNR